MPSGNELLKLSLEVALAAQEAPEEATGLSKPAEQTHNIFKSGAMDQGYGAQGPSPVQYTYAYPVNPAQEQQLGQAGVEADQGVQSEKMKKWAVTLTNAADQKSFIILKVPAACTVPEIRKYLDYLVHPEKFTQPEPEEPEQGVVVPLVGPKRLSKKRGRGQKYDLKDLDQGAYPENAEPGPNGFYEQCLSCYAQLEFGESHLCGTFQETNRSLHRCNHCGKPFNQKSNATSHVKNVHLRSTVYQCNFCGAIASSKGNLKKHLDQKHNSVPPYQCILCISGHKTRSRKRDRGFTQKGNLKAHLINVHQVFNDDNLISVLDKCKVGV